MAEQNDPGINLRGIFLTGLHFEVKPNLKRGPGFYTTLHIATDIVESTKRLELGLTLELRSSKKPEESAVEIMATIVGRFEQMPGSSLDLKKFSEVNGPAILFPYLREAVSSVTAKSPIGAVLLPPVNIAALVRGEQLNVQTELKVANG